MDKKSKNTLIVSIIALALVLIGVTYAYFAARITGLESASTLSLTAGHMGIIYSEDDAAVSASNIYPREQEWITKTITLTGTNNTNQPMEYNIGLNVTANTFPGGYLTYDLTLLSGSNGTPIATTTNNPISGTGKVKFGKGIFTNANNATHTYELKIYFKDNGGDQNDAQEAVFNAKVYVEEAKNEPDGWSNPPAGSLMAGIKSNNSASNEIATVPGQENSSSGLADFTTIAFTGWEGDLRFANSTDDLRNNTNVTTGTYDNNYTNLTGKYFEFTGASGIYHYFLSATSQDSEVIGPIVTEAYSQVESRLGSTEDDYGTSYYYRGEVEDNFVSFAGMCWRIVRIDGQGNIKIVLYNYNPTGAQNPCDSSLDANTMAFARLTANDASSYTSAFNATGNKNTYIGYMYSNNPDSSDYATAHANDNDSTILTNLKSWYDRVFTSTDKDKLADVIWCNDKRVVTDTTYNPSNYNNVLGTGVGTDTTYYQAAKRIEPTNTALPSLKCGESKSDNLISKFTASTSTDGGYGNGKLNGYKIGLLTADEIAFAGATTDQTFGTNTTYYLFKNAYRDYLTLSPRVFRNNGIIWDASSAIPASLVTSSQKIRPAVSLKSNVQITGSGTQASPFVVQ